MTALETPYQRSFLLPFFVFLIALILSVTFQEPWLMTIPFVWVLIPPLFSYFILHTEQLFWLLLLTLPLSTEWNINHSLGLDFPDEIFMLLLTGISIAKLVHIPRWFPRSLAIHPLFFILCLYFFWLMITVVCSVEPVLSVKFVLAKTWFIIPFVMLPQILLFSMDRIRKMALCLVIPMLLLVVQVLIRHSFYQLSFESIKKIMFPFFRNHVNYSSMLVSLLPVGWCFWKLTPRESKRKKWITIALIIGLAGLLFAYSRGAWMALLAGVGAVWLIRKKWMGFLILISISAILVSTAWLVTDKNFMRFVPDHDRTVYNTDFGKHMMATVALKDVSNAERFYRWVAGARMLADRPITGFGPNTFYLHYRPYTVNRFQTWVSDNPEHSTVHNYFILVALEQGIIGLLLFCLLYFGMLMAVQRIYHQLQSRFYQTVTLATGSILIMIGVINCSSDMIETDKVGSLFWLCLGMIILLDTKLKEEKSTLANNQFSPITTTIS